ncbi:TetR/AcrR family transcriptional regulator [Bradyrhizobium sp. S69]|jgi:AcrR family transcriptional regulator|uniref:TetR/AcrR family transcriptional regulator n=1 Tax=Bradyrhizobium sp. S69 TaxID=1641856 RepID=UPI00131AAB72|nr:TetR/AcrR family transcriptional regulator [Bradyrhizobium sp. S69]
MAIAKTRPVKKAKSRLGQIAPQQERAVQTRDHLLDVAGELLGEVGIENISTNMICARAGMTPPALYRYFKDKHAVLETLGQRLMDRQNEALLSWLERHTPDGIDALTTHLEDLMRETARITRAEPGGVWIERALRASPKLAHVRVASHQFVTDRITDAFAPLLPGVPRKALWRRVRLTVEFGYAVDEMLDEEDRISRNDIFRDASRILNLAVLDLQRSEV